MFAADIMRTLMGDLGHYSPVMPKDRLRAYKKKKKKRKTFNSNLINLQRSIFTSETLALPYLYRLRNRALDQYAKASV